MDRVATRAFVCCMLWGLSCAPAPNETPDDSIISEVAAFGDPIDDAAWDALGPRPTGAAPLPRVAIRLADYWQVDRWERAQRMETAYFFTMRANKLLAQFPDAALALYLDAIRVAPLLLPPWMHATELLLRREDVLRGYAMARQYQRLAAPRDGVPWYLLGKSHALLRHRDKAMRLYEKAIEFGAADRTGVVVELALLHLEVGNVATAESLQTEFAIEHRALALLTRAKRQRQAGNTRLAVQLLEEAAADSTALRGTREELASTLIELGDFAAAEATYQQVLAATPEVPSAIVGLARIEMAQEKFAAAEERLTALIERQPNNLVAHFNLGTTILEQGRRAQIEMEQLQRAEDEFSRCIDADFQVRAALWGRAESRLRRNHLRRAYAEASAVPALGRCISDNALGTHSVECWFQAGGLADTARCREEQRARP